MSNSLLNLDIKSIRSLKMPGWLRFGAPAASSASGARVTWPPVAFELGGGEITLARLAKDTDRKWSLTSFDVAAMPEGVMEGEAFHQTLKAPDRLKSIVAAMMQKEGVKTSAVSLVIPDHLARVSLVALPRWGKRTTFSIVSSSGETMGSRSNTSSPAPAMVQA